jgi:hypothetical protein
VRVDSGVPPPLRCTPDGGDAGGHGAGGGAGPGGGAGGGAPPCHCATTLTAGALADLVERSVRHGWGRWLEEGAVVVDC